MSHVIDTGNRALRAPVSAQCALAGLGALLFASSLQPELFVMSRVHALRPATTPVACVMPAGIAPEIKALSRDIGRRFHLPQSAAQSITNAAFTAARVQGIEPTLVLAVAAVESKFKARAINASTGAAGLMQVMSKWHPEKVSRIGGAPSLLLIAPNLNVGAAILAEYVEAEDGNLPDALGHYLGTAGGETYVGRVQREKAHLERVLKTI